MLDSTASRRYPEFLTVGNEGSGLGKPIVLPLIYGETKGNPIIVVVLGGDGHSIPAGICTSSPRGAGSRRVFSGRRPHPPLAGYNARDFSVLGQISGEDRAGDTGGGAQAASQQLEKSGRPFLLLFKHVDPV